MLIISLIFSVSLATANEVEPRGIDLGEYAFGIPVNQLNFNNQSPFTFSFWLNIKEFNQQEFQRHILPSQYLVVARYLL